MNERLFKLAGQAISEVSVPLDFKHEHFLFAEKFAELIVRECIGCCEQVISDPVPNYYIDTWLNGGSQCIDEIKQHFGVE